MMGITYDDKRYCQMCGELNTIKSTDADNTEIICECETVCTHCGHEDYWVRGHFQTIPNSEKVQISVKKTIDKIKLMSKEEFRELIKNSEVLKPTCNPDTCCGECQGMGWCKLAKRFRGEKFDEK